MWHGEDKLWLHYRADIIAADVPDGIFLADFLRYIAINKIYTSSLEIIDLQKYKIICNPLKLRSGLKERANIPFVFVVSRN